MGNWIGYGGTGLETGLLFTLAAPDPIVPGYYLKYENRTGMSIVFVPETLVAGRSFSNVGGNVEEGIIQEMRTTFGRIALLTRGRGEVDLSYHKIEDAVFHTSEGGSAIRLVNKTGVSSIKGTLVCTDTTIDRACKVADADDECVMGAIYNSGVADGSEIWVVISGVAQVLLEDTTVSTKGYWARTSITQAGRADITNADPPGAAVVNLDIHMREIGHCIESKGAGTDVLAECILHPN